MDKFVIGNIEESRDDKITSVTEYKPYQEDDNKSSHVPDYKMLETNLEKAGLMVDDIILKKYLYNLSDMTVVPMDENLKKISDIRIFKITQMVYQNNEFSIYKFASVFNSVQNLNCSVFVIVDSDGTKTDFYMGVRSHDDMRTTKSLKDTLKNSLIGQFPGVMTHDLLDSDAESLISDFPTKNIAAVSCVANNKNKDITDNKSFIQGLEKFVLAMQGQKYTSVIVAASTPTAQLEEVKHAYETLYTQLSPFANLQVSYGTNTALTISKSLSHGTSTSEAHTDSISHQTSRNQSESESVTKVSTAGSAIKFISRAALGIASIITAPLTGNVSYIVAGALGAGNIAAETFQPEQKCSGKSKGTSEGYVKGQTDSFTYSENNTKSETESVNSGKTESIQLTMKNKDIIDTLEKIDLQLKRIIECESLGMWECAAYFLSDSQETVEMAAGNYKALMRGENSGVETSAINCWNSRNNQSIAIIHDYISNFMHPVFVYQKAGQSLPVTASSLVSSNELAIQMGLPRRSVCGFPVVEHAEFGKEAIKTGGSNVNRSFIAGKVFNMGNVTDTDVRLNIDSLTMHTFVTGSTGAGKSNTVYSILDSLRNLYSIPFLVIEPAKGEYKSVFGKLPDVSVYGTNPKKTNVLRINPFSFPAEIHVLEHLDRLVEIFNVCWPMYAAMPAILKDAIEKAYISVGWDMGASENPKGNVFPNFKDVLEQIENVINNSKYSSDSKGDYSGALLTRVASLTTGLNSLLFCDGGLKDEDLFDKNVIIDLSRVGSTETKALVMGLLVMKLNEYRMVSGKQNSMLSHVTVLEEAHNILRRTSTEQSADNSNLLGKSVEMLSNSIAELRTYGEGFIIADQSPNLMDMSVIRNTNTKIILRLPDKSDRELVGYAASLNEEQIAELSKLEKGVAAVYQNDWIEPVLVKVRKCELQESEYKFENKDNDGSAKKVWNETMVFLFSGIIGTKKTFDLGYIRDNIESLNLSFRNREILEKYLDEYITNNSLSVWDDDSYFKFAKKISELTESRSMIDNFMTKSNTIDDFDNELIKLAGKFVFKDDEEIIYSLCKCWMTDMRLQPSNSESRNLYYNEWNKYVTDREGFV